LSTDHQSSVQSGADNNVSMYQDSVVALHQHRNSL